jgi:hypothetical protein
MSAVHVSALFVREHLRMRTTLVLLVVIPILFVVLAGSVLGDFSRALGGTALNGNAATALGAGWAAAFLAGAVGFFQTSSSRDADRRLSLAGFGAMRTAAARLSASLFLALLVSAAAYVTLWLKAGVEHPVHAAVAILAFAVVYLAVGAIVGSIVRDSLEGSMAVAFIFLLDVFSGRLVTAGSSIPALTAKASDLLAAGALGQTSSSGDWIWTLVTVVVALAVAVSVFWLSARARS